MRKGREKREEEDEEEGKEEGEEEEEEWKEEREEEEEEEEGNEKEEEQREGESGGTEGGRSGGGRGRTGWARGRGELEVEGVIASSVSELTEGKEDSLPERTLSSSSDGGESEGVEGEGVEGEGVEVDHTAIMLNLLSTLDAHLEAGGVAGTAALLYTLPRASDTMKASITHSSVLASTLAR